MYLKDQNNLEWNKYTSTEKLYRGGCEPICTVVFENRKY
jgi:hypothetical protein